MKDSSFNCPDDIIEFLTKLVNFFKIANVKGQVKDVHTNDESRAVLSSPDDERLNFLLSLADMVVKMSCKRQVVKVKQLPELKLALSKEVKMALVYIAGVYLEKAQLQMIHIFMLPNMELTSKN